MLAPGRATWDGRHAHVDGAINEPRGLQEPRVPIMVGGNGRTVTWRLAARLADELNLNMLEPAALEEALPVVRERCDEIGRDPATLPISLHFDRRKASVAGQERIDWLGRYRELGLSRVQCMVIPAVDSDEALHRFAEDCRSSGATLQP
jgi:hypothetical protein